MASSLGQFLRSGTVNARLAQLALVAYLVLSGVSVAWGLSGETGPDNALSAQIQWDSTSDYPSVSVTNMSGSDWTTVRVVLDGRFYHQVERVPKGQTLAVATGQFRDSYQLPRPSGMYVYERTFQREPIGNPAVPVDYRPTRVDLFADQGHVVEEVH